MRVGVVVGGVWGYPRKRRGGGLDVAVGKGVVLRDRVSGGMVLLK